MHSRLTPVVWLAAACLMAGLACGPAGLQPAASPTAPAALPTITPQPATATPQATPTPASASDLPQMLVEEGESFGVAIGHPDAPVTLVEFADFSCPHCHDLFPVIAQLIDQYGLTGDLRVVFKPLPFLYAPFSERAARAALCAAAQEGNWAVIEAMWELHGSAGPQAFTESRLAALANDAGLDGASLSTCAGDQETTTVMMAIYDEAVGLNIPGVPYVMVNGEEVPYRGADVALADLSRAIEAALGD